MIELSNRKSSVSFLNASTCKCFSGCKQTQLVRERKVDWIGDFAGLNHDFAVYSQHMGMSSQPD